MRTRGLRASPARRPRHARRANAILLLDDGESCVQIAKFLYLDDDTIRGWHKTYREAGWDALSVDGWKGAQARMTSAQEAELAHAWMVASVALWRRLWLISPRNMGWSIRTRAASSFWPGWALNTASRRVYHASPQPKAGRIHCSIRAVTERAG